MFQSPLNFKKGRSIINQQQKTKNQDAPPTSYYIISNNQTYLEASRNERQDTIDHTNHCLFYCFNYQINLTMSFGNYNTQQQAPDYSVPQAGNDGISSLTWSPTSNILTSTNWDGGVRCWEVQEQNTQIQAVPKAQGKAFDVDV